MTNRDEFSESTKRALRERVGGRCSRPECGRATVAPNNEDAARVDITGRAAHITAARAGGARFDSALTPEQRKSPENGIWLCADCADLVDKNAGLGFKVEQLRSWKHLAEERQMSFARLQRQTRRPAWLDGITTPHYINVPRLLHIAGHRALSDAVLDSLRDGFPRNRAIIRELVEIETTVRQLAITAIDVREIAEPATQISEGLFISYYQMCRTKNAASKDPNNVTNYSFDRSPLIYLDSNGYRYIQPYDPIWLTTNTATGTVRSGVSKLAGIGIVKTIDHNRKHIVASPLLFGIPRLLNWDTYSLMS